MAEGVQIKIATDQAVEAQKKLDAATKDTFVSLEQQNKKIQTLETQLAGYGDAQTRVVTATRASAEEYGRVASGLGIYGAQVASARKEIDLYGSGSKIAAAGSEELADSVRVAGIASAAAGRSTGTLATNIGIYGAKSTAAAKGLADLGAKSVETAAGATKLGAASNATTGFLQKLLAAAGQGGAARGVGLLASGTKALVTSMNPVGIATGLAAAAVVAFATNVLFAEDATTRMRRELREANSSVDVFAAGLSRVDGILGSLASARSGSAFQSLAKEGERLASVLSSQEDAATALSASIRRSSAPVELYDKQIASLAEKTGETTNFFRAFDAVIAKNGTAFEDLSRTEQNYVRQLAETNGIRRENNVLVLSSAEAQKQLKEAIDRTGQALEENKRRQLIERDAGIGAGVDAAREALEEEAALAKLGNAERSAEIELKKILAGTTGILTDEQVKSINAYRAEAKAIDESNEAKRAQVEAEREFARAFEEGAREQVRNQERLEQLNERRADVVRQLKDDADILLAVGEDEIRQKQTQAKLNDILAQTETDRNSEAGKAIEASVLRVEEAEKLNKKLGEVRDLGASTGATIGQGLLNAARSGQTLRQALGNIAEGLSQLLAQKFIIDALARLGAAAFGSFFAPTPGAPSGNNIGPTQSNGQFARGGFLPSAQGPTGAARGLLLDRFQTFTYNGSRITTNEGGAATPEAVMPLERDQFGRLGVISAGGGGSITVNVSGVRTAADARAIRPTFRQMIDSVDRSRSRNRGGLRAGR